MSLLLFTTLLGSTATGLYAGVSPRIAQRLYKRSLFTDTETIPSDPKLIEDFAWPNKTGLVIPAEEGNKLHAWFFYGSDDDLAIYYIGRSSCISNCLPEISHLLSAGYSVLIGEYRGFGETPGSPSVPGICLDGLSIFDYAVNTIGYQPSQITVYGESLGGGVASFVARARQPRALVLKNTFLSLPSIGREKVPFVRIYPDWMYPRNHLQNAAWIKDWTGALLVVHAVNDDTFLS